jgi:Ca2+-binding RTX toxin-like protein
VITGGDALDIIKGGEGADAIEAGGGADLITGGAGADYLRGGAGDDAYIYDSANFGTDLIEDSTGTLVGKTGGAYDVNSLAYVGGGYEYRKYSMGTMTLLGINAQGDGKNTVRGYYRTRSCSRYILKCYRPKRHIKLLKTACKASRHHCTA